MVAFFSGSMRKLSLLAAATSAAFIAPPACAATLAHGESFIKEPRVNYSSSTLYNISRGVPW